MEGERESTNIPQPLADSCLGLSVPRQRCCFHCAKCSSNQQWLKEEMLHSIVCALKSKIYPDTLRDMCSLYVAASYIQYKQNLFWGSFVGRWRGS